MKDTQNQVSAILLAGGFGTRLKPWTDKIPKPMLPIGGRPLLDRIVDQVSSAGINDIVLALHHLPHVIISWFYGQGYKSGRHIGFSLERTPLDTAGGIRHAMRMRKTQHDTVLVLNCDIWSDIDLAALISRHQDAGADLTMALAQVEDPSRYGVAMMAKSGQIERFVEKPIVSLGTHWINAGAYVFRREILEAIPENQPVSLEHVTIPELLASGGHIEGYKHFGRWIDIGTPQSYELANHAV